MYSHRHITYNWVIFPFQCKSLPPPKTQKEEEEEEEDHVSSTKPTFFQIYSNCLCTTTTKKIYNRQIIAWEQEKNHKIYNTKILQ